MSEQDNQGQEMYRPERGADFMAPGGPRQANEPRTFWLQQGPPQQGKESGLAGVAEPGEFLMVTGYGTYINKGTKAEPRWEPYTPPSSAFTISR